MSSQQVHPVTGMTSVRVGSSAGTRVGSSGGDSATSAAAGGKTLPSAGTQPPANKAALAAAVSELNEHVQRIQRDIEFSIDQDSGRTVIKVVDSKNKEVIRQIPSEEALSLAHRLDELRGGSILKVKA